VFHYTHTRNEVETENIGTEAGSNLLWPPCCWASPNPLRSLWRIYTYTHMCT
jgi:hypothetical protein